MKEEILNELVVVKRSGQRVSFNGTKVALLLKKVLIVYMKNMMKN